MTSFAFILGVLPLALASGAGSASQRAIGTGVMGGMITATVLAVFLVPVFFVVLRRLFPATGHEAPHATTIGSAVTDAAKPGPETRVSCPGSAAVGHGSWRKTRFSTQRGTHLAALGFFPSVYCPGVPAMSSTVHPVDEQLPSGKLA
eukprot:gene41522-65616_t